ncbi:cox cluster protein [Halobacteriales archaeon QS_8_65_32]|jgi:hypothetical protein|nr:MAG: cox cluster protein [Halobacteriales archaeon QS_8_65_32]
MDEQPGLSEQYRRASAWPLFVALGLPLAEIGVLFGLVPVAVGGLLLFVGSIAGITQESGYVERPWNLLAGLGGVLLVLGAVLALSQIPFSAGALTAALASNGLVVRGVSIVIAGFVAIGVGGVGRFVEPQSV